jgi:hypothetical protein
MADFVALYNAHYLRWTTAPTYLSRIYALEVFLDFVLAQSKLQPARHPAFDRMVLAFEEQCLFLRAELPKDIGVNPVLADEAHLKKLRDVLEKLEFVEYVCAEIKLMS